jgi:heme-degrading monooxygenase HmoA
MYARVTNNMVPKDKLDEQIKSVKETLSEAKKAKGYKGYLHLRNLETGEVLTVSLWDTEADMLASEKGYFAEAVKRATTIGSKPLSRKYFVVGIKD